jgi:hypothetical protein
MQSIKNDPNPQYNALNDDEVPGANSFEPNLQSLHHASAGALAECGRIFVREVLVTAHGLRD